MLPRGHCLRSYEKLEAGLHRQCKVRRRLPSLQGLRQPVKVAGVWRRRVSLCSRAFLLLWWSVKSPLLPLCDSASFSSSFLSLFMHAKNITTSIHAPPTQTPKLPTNSPPLTRAQTEVMDLTPHVALMNKYFIYITLTRGMQQPYGVANVAAWKTIICGHCHTSDPGTLNNVVSYIKSQISNTDANSPLDVAKSLCFTCTGELSQFNFKTPTELIVDGEMSESDLNIEATSPSTPIREPASSASFPMRSLARSQTTRTRSCMFGSRRRCGRSPRCQISE